MLCFASIWNYLLLRAKEWLTINFSISSHKIKRIILKGGHCFTIVSFHLTNVM